MEDIEKTRAELRELSEELERATKSSNADGYQKTKEKMNKASNRLEMYEKRHDSLKSKALIDESEYHALVTGIMDELTEQCERDRSEILPLLERIMVIVDNNKKLVDEGNKTLLRLQHEIFRDADRKIINGIYYARDQKRFKDERVLNFKHIAYNPVYISLTREQGDRA